MPDLDALKIELEKPRYDTAIRAGSNGELLALLTELSSGADKVWRDIPVDEFLDVIASESLTVEQEDRVQTYTAQRETVPVSKPNVRSWIQTNIPNAVTTLRDLAEVTPHHAEAAGVGERVTLADVRKVVRRIPVSLIVASSQATLET